jgi:hypothetical protein
VQIGALGDELVVAAFTSRNPIVAPSSSSAAAG